MKRTLLAAVLGLLLSMQAPAQIQDTLIITPEGLTTGIYGHFGGSTILSTFDRRPLHGGTVEFSIPFRHGFLKLFGTSFAQQAGPSAGIEYGWPLNSAAEFQLYASVGVHYSSETGTEAMQYLGLPVGATLFVPLGQVDGVSATADLYPNIALISGGRGGISFLFMLKYSIALSGE